VRRYFRRHADGDTGGAIQQAERQSGRKQGWFIVGAIVIGLPVHRTFIEFGQ
jgi:hypothetical protein